MIQNNTYTLVFRPEKGEVSRRSLEVRVGDALPTLPIPQRQGYTFDGWYTEEGGKGQKIVPGDVPDFAEDVILYAHWIKRKAAKKKSLYRKQKHAAVTLAISFALLIVVLIGVNALVSILTFTEEVKTVTDDGEVVITSTTYYVKKIDGIYHLCHMEGSFPNVTFTPLIQNSDGYFITDNQSQVKVDPETGACTLYAVVAREGSEVVNYRANGRVMLFPQLTYDASSAMGQDPATRIDKIEVFNQHGSYTFIREKDTNSFYIDGYATTLYDLNTFASLANTCGYTLSMDRLSDPECNPDGTIRYTEYGLAAETRKDEEGNEYEYAPAKFIVTSGDNTSYTVLVGDAIVSGAGYYVQLEGRDKVYVLSSSGIEDILLQPVEALLTPMITFPSEMNSYFDVEHFVIENIDQDKVLYDILVETCNRIGIDPGVDFEELKDPEKYEQEELNKVFNEVYEEMYEDLAKKYTKVVCDFSYLDLDERQNTMYSSMSYKTDSAYMSGYFPNFDNVNEALYSLYSLVPLRIVKLDPYGFFTAKDGQVLSSELMDECGLEEPAFIVSYYYDDVDEKGETTTIYNRVSISEKNSAGIYYAYGEIMTKGEDGEYFYLYAPMILELHESAAPFLEWSEVDWYDSYFVQLNIAHITDAIYSWKDNTIHFSLDNSSTSQMVYLPGRDTAYNEGTDDDPKLYTIARVDGKYVLTGPDGNVLSPIYTSDYMVSAQFVTKGSVQYPASKGYPRDYIFVESKQDNENGRITYYMYFLVPSAGGYTLCGDVSVYNTAGDLISSKTITGETAYETDFFYAKSGYMFLIHRNGGLASELNDEMGDWGRGTVFVTADDKYILVDNTTGTWFNLGDITSKLYLADRDHCALMQGSAEQKNVTYYPTGNTPLRFNDQEGYFESYNVAKQTWAKATTSQCTLGVWGSGSYYKTAEGSYILVDHETGEWGHIFLANIASTNMVVRGNGKVLDYEVMLQKATGKMQNSTAADNFRNMYQGLLYASVEGATDLTEEQMAELRQTPDSECQLKLTLLATDADGTTRYAIYRFYKYTNMKSYMTVELVDSPDDPGNPENGQGTFFVNATFVEKLIADAQRVLNGEAVVATSKN